MRLSVVVAAATAFTFGAALAKLPAQTDEEKAKAAEAASKAAWTDKVGAFQLCQSMNRTADYYRKSPAGKDAPPPVDTPPCTDPGAFVAPAPPASAPLEAAGAHSPPGMATSPPSSKETAAEKQGQPKK